MGFFNFRRYSLLVSLFYGKRFYTYQADCINNQLFDNCLIVGVGDGEIINHLKKNKAYTLIEKSELFHKIILAKNGHKKFDMKVIWSDYFSWTTKEKFDLVVFPFFLDLLKIEKQKEAIQKASKLLNQNGKILIIDFEQPFTILRKLHLWFLYKLFFLLDGIEGNKVFDPKEDSAKETIVIEGPKNKFYAIKAYLIQPPKPI